MRTSDFYYDLPQELIAQHPLSDRSASRLLTLDGRTGNIEHRMFSEVPEILGAGDLLVINNTRVIPARLLGVRQDTGRPIELLLLKRIDTDHWETLARPGKKVRAGKRLVFIPGRLEAEVEDVLENGNRLIRFIFEGIWEEILHEAGTVPLPPYIHEKLDDPERYQTVYAYEPGSSAAPTAGLHFTESIFDQIRKRGVDIAELTLHVGLGTFRPVKCDDISDHVMHSEWYDFPAETAEKVRKVRQSGGRIVAVGTTCCRTLESVFRSDPMMNECSGWTDIFMYPGFRFRVVDAMITNFHLPESTLIMLVSAFAGKEHVFKAYQEAIERKYRFFSFGDAMYVTGKEHAYNKGMPEERNDKYE
ncbi:MAG: tRNA preQ1(34) S-adenosylmethionine ribosyltransferase-isomerase QueA [Clostridiales bacterium]|nr:tRNA preQ1(34) S-adenosylmethionine ribosyltransferase-isomerase QueA [Clostridiales bacterium]